MNRLSLPQEEKRLYKVWIQMRQRCNNPKNKKFLNYGARGISVCSRWDSFENFLLDMGPRPKGFTLDRINNDGNYEPKNCRWASQKTQSRNRSDNLIIEHNGQKKTLSDWADFLGIEKRTVWARIKAGWKTESVLSNKKFKNGASRISEAP